MSKPFLYFFILTVGTAILAACSGTKKLSDQDLSDIYRRNTKLIDPQFRVYHNGEHKSRIHFKINTRSLVYIKNPSENNFTGRIKMSYSVYDGYDSKTIIDSASTVIEDASDEVKIKNLYGKIDLNLPHGKKYLVKIETGDVNRDRKDVEFLAVDKTSKFSRENFLMKVAETDRIYFHNYTNPSTPLKIEYNFLEAIDFVEVDYFDQSFPVAPPPFSMNPQDPPSIKPDNNFVIKLDSDNQFEFKPDKKGIYHFRPDPESREGLTLFYFDDDYPEIRNTDEMVSALRFITSKKEYENLTQSMHTKQAIDSFWLNTAGSKPRARELIKAYYNRVQNANLFFSSYKEGWKTDRGIIYMIFGPPNSVYKSKDAEAWVYGESNSHLSVNYIFNKGTSPFTDNHYTLKRSPNYKNHWYRAVESWRQGRVSSLDY